MRLNRAADAVGTAVGGMVWTVRCCTSCSRRRWRSNHRGPGQIARFSGVYAADLVNAAGPSPHLGPNRNMVRISSQETLLLLLQASLGYETMAQQIISRTDD